MSVYIVGIGMTPFGRFPGKSVKELTRQAVGDALGDAGCPTTDIDAAWFANTRQPILEGQNTIRGQIALGVMASPEYPSSMSRTPVPAAAPPSARRSLEENLGSVGRPGLPTSVGILDGDGMPLEKGGDGEVCVLGDIVMGGYWRAPDLTARTIVDGWLRTGDIGRFERGCSFSGAGRTARSSPAGSTSIPSMSSARC